MPFDNFRMHYTNRKENSVKDEKGLKAYLGVDEILESPLSKRNGACFVLLSVDMPSLELEDAIRLRYLVENPDLHYNLDRGNRQDANLHYTLRWQYCYLLTLNNHRSSLRST